MFAIELIRAFAVTTLFLSVFAAGCIAYYMFRS